MAAKTPRQVTFDLEDDIVTTPRQATAEETTVDDETDEAAAPEDKAVLAHRLVRAFKGALWRHTAFTALDLYNSMVGHRKGARESAAARVNRQNAIRLRPKSEQLFAAVNDHNLTRVIELLEEHAEPSSSDLPPDAQANALDLNWQEPIMGESSLLRASKLGYHSIVKRLVQFGGGDDKRKADDELAIDLVDHCGCTALMHAAANGFDQVCKLLLEESKSQKTGTLGIMKDPEGWSALMHAADNGHVFVLEYLKNYSDITVRSKNGDTVLIKAVRNGHEAAVRTIVRWEPDLELADRQGNTPFLVAFQYGQLAILEFLVKVGVDTEAKNAYGQTYHTMAPLPRAIANWRGSVLESESDGVVPIEEQLAHIKAVMVARVKKSKEAIVKEKSRPNFLAKRPEVSMRQFRKAHQQTLEQVKTERGMHVDLQLSDVVRKTLHERLGDKVAKRCMRG